MKRISSEKTLEKLEDYGKDVDRVYKETGELAAGFVDEADYLEFKLYALLCKMQDDGFEHVIGQSFSKYNNREIGEYENN